MAFVGQRDGQAASQAAAGAGDEDIQGFRHDLFLIVEIENRLRVGVRVRVRPFNLQGESNLTLKTSILDTNIVAFLRYCDVILPPWRGSARAFPPIGDGN